MNFLLSLSLRSYTTTEEEKLRELDWSAEIPSPNFQWNRRSLDFHSLVIPKNAAQKKNDEWVEKMRRKIITKSSLFYVFRWSIRAAVAHPKKNLLSDDRDGWRRRWWGHAGWSKQRNMTRELEIETNAQHSVCIWDDFEYILYYMKSRMASKKRQQQEGKRNYVLCMREWHRDGARWDVDDNHHVILLVFFFREKFSCTWTSLKLRVIMASRHK